jgi:hypothetical protein
MKNLTHLAACICLALALSGTARADTVTLSFDELPNQPVNGLSFMGVTFNFSMNGLPSPEARLNAVGLGDGAYVQGPVLEGNAEGTLILDFAVPTSLLSFSVARNSLDVLMPGATVELFDPDLQSLGIFTLDMEPVFLFSEAQYIYSGAAVRRAMITFSNPEEADRFALDNLTVTQPVPEPSTILLISTGLIGLGIPALKRKSS